jgi:hypothetical protein
LIQPIFAIFRRLTLPPVSAISRRLCCAQRAMRDIFVCADARGVPRVMLMRRCASFADAAAFHAG